MVSGEWWLYEGLNTCMVLGGKTPTCSLQDSRGFTYFIRKEWTEGQLRPWQHLRIQKCFTSILRPAGTGPAGISGTKTGNLKEDVPDLEELDDLLKTHEARLKELPEVGLGAETSQRGPRGGGKCGDGLGSTESRYRLVEEVSPCF